MQEASFVDVFRLILGIVSVLCLVLVVVFIGMSVKNQQKILINAELDRQDRQRAILDLQRAATDLAAKTQQTIESNAAAERQRDEILKALHEKMDKNIDASQTALSAANSVNEKIQQTNERLLEVANGKMIVNVDVKKDGA